MSMSTHKKKGTVPGGSGAVKANRVRRRVNPAAVSAEELLRILGTDAQKGLSPREAEKRLYSQSAKRCSPLFRTNAMTPSGCVKRLCREPVLWLYAAVCLSALFFGRTAIGIACLGMTLAYGAVCTACYAHAQRVDAVMQTMEAPLCRVLRNGMIRRVIAEEIVRGDVILLYPGDVVPADARLLSATDDFCVTERELTGNPSEGRTVRLKKRSDVTVFSAASRCCSSENMVFAGGVVDKGRARAVVVATGTQTHLGALTGGIKPVARGGMTASVRRAEKILNVVNLALLVLVIPITGIGILTLGNRYDLLDIVLAAMTPCLTSLTGHLFIRLSFLGASLRAMCAADRDAANSAEIRTTETLNSLNKADELVLVGTAGLHDGVPHPEFLTVGAARFDCTRPESNAASERFAALAYLYRAALPDTVCDCLPISDRREELLRERLSLLDALTDWAELSPEGVLTRVSSHAAVESKQQDGLPAVEIQWTDGHASTVYLSSDIEEAMKCSFLPDSGAVHPATAEEKEAVRLSFRQATLAGLRVCFLISARQDDSCLEGMIAYGPHSCRKTEGTVRTLTASGIRVTVFLRDITEENTRILSECGITSSYPADRPNPGEQRRPAVLLRKSGIAAFEGCSEAYISEYIHARRKEGGRICLLTGESRDRRLLESAYVACTVSPGMYRSIMDFRTNGTGIAGLDPEEHCTMDGGHDSAVASDLCRRRSDIIVRRVNHEGGGIMGVRQAFLTAARYRASLYGAVRFFAISQLLRVLMLVVPICMGAALPSAPWLLLSGLAVDTLALLSLAANDTDPSLTRSRTSDSDFRTMLRSLLPDLIGAAAAVACLWTAAGVGLLLTVNFGTGNLGAFAGLSVLTIQLTLCVTDRTLTRSTRSGFGILLLFLLLWAGSLAVALGSGLRLYWSLVFPLCGGLLFMVFRALASLAMRIPEHGRKGKPGNR